MYLASGKLRGGAARDRPRSAFVLPNREERDIPEQIIASANDAIESGFLQTQIGQKCGRISRVELRDLELDLRADCDDGCPGARQKRGQCDGISPAIGARSVLAGTGRCQLGFVEIDHDEQWLRGQKLKPTQTSQVVPLEVERAQRASLLERGAANRQHITFVFELRSTCLLEILLQPLEPALGDPKVGQDQLVLHGLCIPRRID